ncbi:hypothetical protein MPNT_40110 [Candidatus Methylacidithermus pantelleriae]|uniref:Uncharacterized protein n=1 Tax=Candidatus Methylacidithermus pantelleriae TaxID=2744239 RepID=A0A8J2FSW1_9BACT|nr:hypothetical protein MPNT_40110 [Candidatus Methylacidithermus pantelleriae]
MEIGNSAEFFCLGIQAKARAPNCEKKVL